MKDNNNYFKIKKSYNLNGTIMIDGAKNAVLPIIIASLLTKGVSYIYGVPAINDVYSSIYLLELYNVSVIYDKKKSMLIVDSTNITNYKIGVSDFKLLRTSVLFASVILQNFSEFYLASPGGDSIGKRPLDIHLDGLESFGVSITKELDYLYLKKDASSVNTEFYLSFPSVGATQNLLLFAAQNEGKITLYNTAQEPEVFDLINVLKLMGVNIECFFGGTIVIYGQKNLKSFSYFVMPDRLEAATFLIASAITEGNVFLPNMPAYSIRSCLHMLQKCGHTIEIGSSGYGITCIGNKSLKNNEIVIRTMPYPSFSSDYQSLFLSLLTLQPGRSYIYENIFENRFLHIDQLNSMGARINKLNENLISIDGIDALEGRHLIAQDIRSGAGLLLAGLAAIGETYVHSVGHILRGYCNIDKKLYEIGADIEYCQEENNLLNVTQKNNNIQKNVLELII